MGRGDSCRTNHFVPYMSTIVHLLWDSPHCVMIVVLQGGMKRVGVSKSLGKRGVSRSDNSGLVSQSQFHLGLREAAANLGVCPTTLKRACRRNGLASWPRRELEQQRAANLQSPMLGDPGSLGGPRPLHSSLSSPPLLMPHVAWPAPFNTPGGAPSSLADISAVLAAVMGPRGVTFTVPQVPSAVPPPEPCKSPGKG